MKTAESKRFATIAIVLVTCLGTASCAQDVDRPAAQYSIAQFMESTSYRSASFSPDGSKLLVSHNGTGIFNVYAIPADGGELPLLCDMMGIGMAASSIAA